ncbi:MAG: hypothetical protein U1F57_08485 [bacterium]
MSPPGLGGLGSPPPAGSTAAPSQSRLESNSSPQRNGLGGIGSSSTPGSAPSSLGSFDSAPPPPPPSVPSQTPVQNVRPAVHERMVLENRRAPLTDRFSSGGEMERAGRGENFPANWRNSRVEIQSAREWGRFSQRLETFLGQAEVNARAVTLEHPLSNAFTELEMHHPFFSTMASLGNLFSRSSSIMSSLFQGLSQLLGTRLPVGEVKDPRVAVTMPSLPPSAPKESQPIPRENVVSSRTPEISKESAAALSAFSQKWMAQLINTLPPHVSANGLISLLSSEEGVRALALPPEQLKALYEALLKTFPNAFKPLVFSGTSAELPYPLILKNLMQGILYLVALPGMANPAANLSPVWRLLFGNLLFQKVEVDLHNYHSVLLDELGALMARRTRRVRRRERKKISRADRVMAKDHSLPIDTHSQDEGDAPDDFDFLKDPPANKDVSSFLWH